jgi:hypothetical protein
VCLLAAVLVSLVMVGIGFLHAAPMDIKTNMQGVVRLNCTIIQTCGYYCILKLFLKLVVWMFGVNCELTSNEFWSDQYDEIRTAEMRP